MVAHMDILEASLLRAPDNEPGMSPNLAEEATLLGDDPALQGVQAVTTHPSNHPQETPKCKDAAKLEWTAADLQGMQRQPLLLSPGFEHPVSGPPPLKSGEPQVRIPGEAQLDLTSMASMQMAIVRNKSTGELKCWYETQVVGSLCLGQPDMLPEGDAWASLIPCLRVNKETLNCELSMKPAQS